MNSALDNKLISLHEGFNLATDFAAENLLSKIRPPRVLQTAARKQEFE